MRTRCRRCGEYSGTHAAQGAITTIGPAAAVVAFVVGVLGSRVWWLWLALTAPVAWVILSLIFWELPRWLTRIANCFRRCPHCGGRAWASPESSGFGL